MGGRVMNQKAEIKNKVYDGTGDVHRAQVITGTESGLRPSSSLSLVLGSHSALRLLSLVFVHFENDCGTNLDIHLAILYQPWRLPQPVGVGFHLL